MAFSISKFFATAAIIASAMLLGRANACLCEWPPLPFCDRIINGDLVVQARVVDKVQESFLGDITYTALIGDVIKPESPDIVYPQQITFTTPGSPGFCGLYLERQETYILDLFRDENLQLRTNSCRLVRLAHAVEEELQECLAGNCNFNCGISQECAFDDMANVMYCTDSCEAVVCNKGEECFLNSPRCLPVSHCPPTAVCRRKNK